MKETFHSKETIPRETFLSLIKRENHPASFRFLILIMLTFLSGFLVVYCWSMNGFLVVASLLFFGIVNCSNFACLHETAHGTAFQSKKLNQLAAFFCGIIHIYPSTAFKELHFTHHRFTHIPGKDPEISLGNKPAPSILANPPLYLGWLSGFPLLNFKIFMMISSLFGMPEFLRTNLFPFIKPKVRVKLFFESLIVLGIQILIIYIAINFDPRFWGLIIGQIVGHCILSTYLIMEHNGLPHDGDIFEKTRSINTVSFVKLIMWNMPYHAEHHAFPAVPFHKLPDLHQSLKTEILHKEEGMVEFHKKALKNF